LPLYQTNSSSQSSEFLWSNTHSSPTFTLSLTGYLATLFRFPSSPLFLFFPWFSLRYSVIWFSLPVSFLIIFLLLIESLSQCFLCVLASDSLLPTTLSLSLAFSFLVFVSSYYLDSFYLFTQSFSLQHFNPMSYILCPMLSYTLTLFIYLFVYLVLPNDLPLIFLFPTPL